MFKTKSLRQLPEAFCLNLAKNYTRDGAVNPFQSVSGKRLMYKDPANNRVIINAKIADALLHTHLAFQSFQVRDYF